MMYYNYGMEFGWIFMILFWGLVIWFFIALIRGSKGVHGRHCCSHHGVGDAKHVGHLGHHSASGHSHRSALNLLEERYVKGEISQTEFNEKKKDLND